MFSGIYRFPFFWVAGVNFRLPFLERFSIGDDTILLPEFSAAEAVIVAERLRQSLYDSHFVTDEGMRIPLRVSVGVVEHKAVEESLTELMVRADHALYRAKREGRNKVVESD